MTRRACLAIGVGTVEAVPGEASPFDYLDGAVFAARTLGQWALHAGFGPANVRVVDDEFVGNASNPVTEERVRQAVRELFPPGAEVVQQLLLAFCGHGCTDANRGSISWLLSDSLQQRYRVHSENFYGELLLYGVRRITLITDACRDAPRSFDLLRLEPRRVLTARGLPVDSPRTDLLAACQDGRRGYMVLGDGPAARGKCVFSGVIVDALWGREESAIERGAITTTSLGRCVRDRTAERAREYGLTLNPQCLTDPEPAILHDPSQAFPATDALQPWPPAKRGAEQVQVDPMLEGDAQIGASIAPETLFELVATTGLPNNGLPATFTGGVTAALRRLRSRLLPLSRRGPPASLVLPVSSLTIQDAAAVWSHRPVNHVDGEPGRVEVLFGLRSISEGVLVEFEDGLFTPITMVPDWYVTTGRGADGSVYQAFGMPGWRDNFAGAVQIVSDFSNGRLGVDRIGALLARLWVGSEPDPVISILCAYLYRTLADYDSIRRLAYLYASRQLSVPFDIALLGAMQVTREADRGLLLHIPALKAVDAVRTGADALHERVQATPPVTASIGGHCPWLGIGWDYVIQAKSEWEPLVADLAQFAGQVRRSGFTCLPHDAGVSMAEHLGFTRHPSDSRSR